MRLAPALVLMLAGACVQAQELPDAPVLPAAIAGPEAVWSPRPDEPLQLPGPPDDTPAPPDEAVPVEEAKPEPLLREVGEGLASWYGPRFHGRRTANGERFDQEALTAAHRTLPFGTVVRVKSLVNGRTVDVRINDRGPHLKRRIIDLSKGAARALGLIEAGTGVKPVVLSILE
jgi:rare lipoprotein A